jgi:DNA-binding NarL/FixJ family response regulator
MVPERSIRVLVVDDYAPFRDFVRTALQKLPELQIIDEASDGLEAAQKAQQLQPELILLDIGLPKLSGIEAARRIREHSPVPKILFVSEYRAWDIAKEALRSGGDGYVVKSNAANELLLAVQSVLQGKPFLSVRLTDRDSRASQNDHAEAIRRCHEVAFCADDISVVDSYARFIEYGLRIGDAVIVIATEAHRASLLSRLEADGVNVAAAIEQGSCVLLDAADMLSRLSVNDMPDPVRCAKVIGNLVTDAAKGVQGGHGRVAVCGEIAPTLLSNGNTEGAMHLEHLWDKITRPYRVHTLCVYLLGTSQRKQGNPIFERICAEHSAIYSR